MSVAWRGVVIVIAIVAIVAWFSYSSESSKRESICVDFVRSVVVDPSGMKINSVRTNVGRMTAEKVKRFMNLTHPGGMNALTKDVLETRLRELDRSEDIFVEVDYTAYEMFGPIRDKALCRYFKWGNGDTELVAVAYRNRSYEQPDLMNLFLLHGQPKGLDGLYSVK